MKQTVLAIVLLILSGCIAPQTTTMHDVNPREWSESVTIVVENDDTLALRRLSFVLRYNRSFRDEGIALDIDIIQPDAASFNEKVDLYPSRPYSPSSIAATETIAYRESSVLRQRGNYLFTITPLHPVRGVEAIGINIEKQ